MRRSRPWSRPERIAQLRQEAGAATSSDANQEASFEDEPAVSGEVEVADEVEELVTTEEEESQVVSAPPTFRITSPAAASSHTGRVLVTWESVPEATSYVLRAVPSVVGDCLVPPAGGFVYEVTQNSHTIPSYGNCYVILSMVALF